MLTIICSPRAARGQEGDDVVESIDDVRGAGTSTPTSKPSVAAPDRFELRGFARSTVIAGLGGSGGRPTNAPEEERVGYDRGTVVTQAYADLDYVRGRSFEARVSGSLAYDVRLSEGRPGDDASPRVESARFEPVLREAYLGFYGETVDLRVGQQRVAWGNSVAFAPNDVVDARDLRSPLVLDPELTRLPTPAVRADVDLGGLVLGLVAQPFFVPDRVSLYGNNWSLVQPDAPRATRRFFGIHARDDERTSADDLEGTLGTSKTPRGFLDGAAVGASARLHAAKIDASAYWHWGPGRSPYVYLDPQVAAQLGAVDPASVDGAALDAVLEQQRRASASYGGPLVVAYYRRHHVGADVTTTAGPLVLRAEAAFDSASTFTAESTLNSVARPAAQAVAGVELHLGGLEKLVVLEGWYMRLLGPEVPIVPVLDRANRGPLLFVSEDTVGLAGLVRWTFFEHLVVEARSFVGVAPRSFMVRPELGYGSSAFTLRAGVLLLGGEPGSYGDYYDRNDSAYLTARWGF